MIDKEIEVKHIRSFNVPKTTATTAITNKQLQQLFDTESHPFKRMATTRTIMNLRVKLDKQMSERATTDITLQQQFTKTHIIVCMLKMLTWKNIHIQMIFMDNEILL